MNIYALKGHKVRCENLSGGYDHDREIAKKYLEVGKEYTVEQTVGIPMYGYENSRTLNLILYFSKMLSNKQKKRIKIIPTIGSFIKIAESYEKTLSRIFLEMTCTYSPTVFAPARFIVFKKRSAALAFKSFIYARSLCSSASSDSS